MIWITGYVGSGKSTLSASIKDSYEFDEIEDLMIKAGYKINKNMSKKEFKKVCKDFLKNTDIKILNGIQSVDYYQKGDKVYFVNTSFIESIRRCKKRDNKEKVKEDIKDNIKLFFKLKLLYLKAFINKDIIKEIK